MVFFQFKEADFDRDKMFSKLKGKKSKDIASPTMTVEVTFCHELYALKLIWGNSRKLYALYAETYHKDGIDTTTDDTKLRALLSLACSDVYFKDPILVQSV